MIPITICRPNNFEKDCCEIKNKKKKERKKESWRRWGSDLANEGAVLFVDPSVAPWDHPEIDNGDKTVLEDLHQIFHYEIGTVRTQSFVVQRHSNILGLRRRTVSWGNERKQCVCENQNGEYLARTHLWPQKQKEKTMKLTHFGRCGFCVVIYGYEIYCVYLFCESNGGSIRILNAIFICSEITIKCESNC